MTAPQSDSPTDEQLLEKLGYRQELARRMSAFSNFAISFSIICILAGGITSFHLGLASVGGASVGIGWPLVTLFALVVAATMGQVASAFPTAGGLYHWASILGGRGWGWATAWFNLGGLVMVAAAINSGTYHFAFDSLGLPKSFTTQVLFLTGITAIQAILNHRGIRVTTILTDFSGYWILVISMLLTVSLFAWAPGWDWNRLVTFTNLSGLPSGEELSPVVPANESLLWLFAFSLMLPAYTLTGYDASAHVSEETRNAERSVPRGIVQSVLISGIAGWIMLIAIMLAIPDLRDAANQGSGAVVWTLRNVLPQPLALGLLLAIILAQYLCGLATITSASRMTYAFARDGGLPASRWLATVSPIRKTPGPAIWTVAIAIIAFTLYTPVYDTIALVCTIFLYVSYVLPTALGFLAHGKRWNHFGPWNLGRWYRPLAGIAVLGCGGLIVLGMQPPNEKAGTTLAIAIGLLVLGWFGYARRHFPGPPVSLLKAEHESANPENRQL
ncbi:amino acid permease [Tuwongella immobilis]|uniref:Amino acid permease/ SLC12A domain-containing protein n=1 Tax=Tuwongella immobilis TaxID=692036 RepID=A0A6C2YPV1_9BACT|nr:amino acid permease [Tuwongella immobilis]VIP03341.1 amino acid permease : Uncharacterized protein OS=Sorangium cellulosum So0157-2 GN=SCE1572_45465 PE=4 SV=1: AA_permease_2 [Tuwongella immobilis]VTS04054.1 amino acid permease : Uncharacterized protein OS=Sorangium cellulosum So0157-2 GN=SCE1572_45465 PE=4 SV=1: AA_permease_2 [Tuwongella immobilis]